MADELEGTAPEPEEPVAPEAPEPEPEAPPADTPPPEPEFTDPATLPPELQALGQRLNASYTKRMQKLAEERRARQADIELLDRFRSDPAFARQVLQAEAQRLGITSAPGPATPPAAQGAVPPQLVQAIEGQLAPELRWMAPSIASAFLAGQQVTLAPLYQQQAQDLQQRAAQEYEALAEELSQQAPGWETHEDDMTDLLTFLQGKDMRSKRWGNKLALLHRLITSDATATATAARRMGEAARTRTTTGQSGRATVANIQDRIRQAKDSKSAFEIAATAAIEEAERAGARVR